MGPGLTARCAGVGLQLSPALLPITDSPLPACPPSPARAGAWRRCAAARAYTWRPTPRCCWCPRSAWCVREAQGCSGTHRCQPAAASERQGDDNTSSRRPRGVQPPPQGSTPRAPHPPAAPCHPAGGVLRQGGGRGGPGDGGNGAPLGLRALGQLGWHCSRARAAAGNTRCPLPAAAPRPGCPLIPSTFDLLPAPRRRTRSWRGRARWTWPSWWWGTPLGERAL